MSEHNYTLFVASYADTGDLSQSRSTIGLFYVLLGRDRFGAVEWRRPSD